MLSVMVPVKVWLAAANSSAAEVIAIAMRLLHGSFPFFLSIWSQSWL